jgi:hypothetical protein
MSRIECDLVLSRREKALTGSRKQVLARNLKHLPLNLLQARPERMVLVLRVAIVGKADSNPTHTGSRGLPYI